MTSQQQLVCDSSTLTNFKQWAQAISGFFSTAGWLQSGDGGQVNWSTIGSVPGSGAFVYEVWEPNDGLTNFYVKMEYGNVAGQTNLPTLRITISTTTDGAGTPTGFVMGPWVLATQNYAVPSSVTQYECDFSGGSGRINAMLWRNAPTEAQQAFGIERSVNGSGVYTGDHVTIVVAGFCGGGNNTNVLQQSLVFGIGPAPAPVGTGRDNQGGGLAVRYFGTGYLGSGSAAFNNAIPMDTLAPIVGFFDYPLTMFGVSTGPDTTEGVTFTTSLYGSIRTYLPSKNGALVFCSPFGYGGQSSTIPAALCMRYD